MNDTQNTLRVLLLSPVRGLDPPNGDVTYTESLLDAPPAGVTYETYDQALLAGRMVELGRRGSASGLRNQLSWWREAAVNRLRVRGVLFAEPFRFFRVNAEAYDLVHVHVFSCRLIGWTGPVLLSNGLPLPALYRDARGWPAWRVHLAQWCDRLLAASLRVDHSSLRVSRADVVVAFTEHLRRWYLDDPVRSRAPTRHVPPGLARPENRSSSARGAGRTVGFVAHDFLAKGGDLVVAAWPIVQERYPNALLLLAGARPSTDVEQLQGIEVLGACDRDTLMTSFFPRLDVLAYPTRFDGSPLVVIEALSFGIPVVVSDYGPMPGLVGGGVGGSIVEKPTAPTLAVALIDLLDARTQLAARARARSLFEARYDRDVTRQQLRDAYDLAVARHG